MRTDEELKRDVEAELAWDAEIGGSKIGVSVQNGVVTLAGFVRSIHDRGCALLDVKRIRGVRGIASSLEVRLPAGDERPDPELARAAAQELQRQLGQDSRAVIVTVSGGRIVLEGRVASFAVKMLAEEAVRRLRGVKAMVNRIVLAPPASACVIDRAIEDALRRRGVPAEWLSVESSAGEVTLRGAVRSWPQRDMAEWTAWQSPGVARVNNLLAVRPGETGATV